MIKVLLLDDHEIIVDGLKSLLHGHGQIKVVAACTEVEEANAQIAAKEVNVVVTDIEMPNQSGLDFMRRLKRRQPHIKILVLTIYNQYALLKEALQAGASGYLLKSAGRDKLIAAIEAVHAGKPYFSPELGSTTAKLYVSSISSLHHNDVQVMFGQLSKREMQIAGLISQGTAYSQIAKQLHLSEHTVKTHKQNIYKKLGVGSKLALYNLMMRHGFL